MSHAEVEREPEQLCKQDHFPGPRTTTLDHSVTCADIATSATAEFVDFSQDIIHNYAPGKIYSRSERSTAVT